jgi:TIR domain-containing protein
MKVFITHAESDEPLARRVVRALEQAGLEVWDEAGEIYPSDNWAKVIGEALEEAEAMIVLLTPKALDSTRVLRDIEFALTNIRFKNRLISVLVGIDDARAKEEVPIIRFSKTIAMPAVGEQEEGIDRITQALKAVA